MINTITSAVKFLEGYIPAPDKKYPGELGLARMKYLMELLGNPQLKYPTIHVGGTSGKGSTSTIIASILATRYKVGLHTSPHLVKITERIKIFSRGPLAISARGPLMKDKDIPEAEFIDLVNYIKPFIEKVGESKLGAPSYFEIITAMAFVYFYRQKVDIAVIEVGMGGRYDATNVISPLVTVLTNVGLDHTEILGSTIEKIAEDKAGIIKPGIQVVSGVKQPSVVKIINEKCKDEKATLSLLIPPPSGESLCSGHPRGVFEVFSYRIKKIDSNGSIFDYKGMKLLKNLRLRLLGEHQIENAALAVKAIEVSRGPLAISARGPLIREIDIRKGLLSAFIPGRLEIVRRKPIVILDGAHNGDKVKALVASIKKIFPQNKITVIVAIKNDKNVQEMLKQLLMISRRVIFTSFKLKGDIGMIRSYDPKELVKIAKNIYTLSAARSSLRQLAERTITRRMIVIPDATAAVAEAIKSAKPDDLILVTGSLYLVGEIKKYTNKQINK